MLLTRTDPFLHITSRQKYYTYSKFTSLKGCMKLLGRCQSNAHHEVFGHSVKGTHCNHAILRFTESQIQSVHFPLLSLPSVTPLEDLTAKAMDCAC